VDNVLGLARTGLIFTRIQEGTQPGGLTQTHLAKQSRVFHTMYCHAGFRCGVGAAGTHLRLGRAGAGPVWENGSLGRVVRFCVFSLSVSLLFLFPLFVVLLNYPYPDPPVSASFFPSSSAPRRGEGQPRGAFVADGSQTRTEMSQSFCV